jgi:RecA-family ATPase
VFPIGEQGVLRAVRIVEPDYVGPRRLDLVIEFHGQNHSGQLWVDDVSVIPKLHRLLRSQIGESLQAIGDLQIDL